MPSMLHEGLLLLFRNRPTLAPELLRDALGIQLPAYTEARVESAEFAEVVPTTYLADLVVLLLDGKPIFAIVVEVQLSRDEDKRRSWPLYLTHLRAKVGCPTALLVVAPDASVARWCAQPIDMGHPGFILSPLVMGPESIPHISDAQVAPRDPELAMLSAMAHGKGDVGGDMARTVFAALQALDAGRLNLYFDLALSSLNDVARTALEALMKSGNYEYQSDFARRYVAQGLEQGLKQGREEGRHEGELAALLEVLDARGLQVDEASRQRLLACTDSLQLKLWLRKAATVETVQDLLG